MSRISESYNTHETEIVDYNHFRPHLMPNLGALRNRLIGVPVDEGFSNPHRGNLRTLINLSFVCLTI